MPMAEVAESHSQDHQRVAGHGHGVGGIMQLAGEALKQLTDGQDGGVVGLDQSADDVDGAAHRYGGRGWGRRALYRKVSPRGDESASKFWPEGSGKGGGSNGAAAGAPHLPREAGATGTPSPLSLLRA